MRSSGACGEDQVVRHALVFRVKNNSSIWGAPTLSVCAGDSVQANIQGDTTNLLWNPTIGVSDPTSSKPWLSPYVTTVYTVLNLNDTTSTKVTVVVDTLAKQMLGGNGTEAWVTNAPTGATVVWYYSGVPIAMNVDTISTPITGDYFAMVMHNACTRFSDTVTVAQANSVPLINQGGSQFIAKGSGQYTVRFNLVQHNNNLNTIHLALVDSGVYKTGSIPEINLFDDQQQLIASGVMQSAGPGLWKATNLNVSLAHSKTYTLMVNTHAGKVALFKPSSLPFTEPNGCG